MYSFGKRSRERLSEVHPSLVKLLEEAIKIVDFSVIEGHRDKETQNRYYDDDKTEVQWPNSRHNSKPSMAVDIAPYPIDWDARNRFFFLAGIIKALAYRHNIEIRWGRDWDSDNDFSDQTFNDLVHFEIKE